MSKSGVKSESPARRTGRLSDGQILLAGMIGSTLLYISAAFLLAFGANGARPVATSAESTPESEVARLDDREILAAMASVGHPERIELERALAAMNAPERLKAPTPAASRAAPDRPRIILIVDDVGPDAQIFEAFRALPGPITYSFLPYAEGVDDLARRAAADGDGVMLHLPMEPRGREDAGPNALTTKMSSTELKRALDWNLNRFSGYTGVNNHMGSRFTRDHAAMETVLERLARLELYFLDSVTTGGSVALDVGASVGASVFARDIFLDAEPGEDFIRTQLARAEELAWETGFAVVICHPRPETLTVVGPWLTSATARGFQLETADFLSALAGDGAGRRYAAAR